MAVGRRADRLDGMVAEGHGDLVGLPADVRVEDDCRRIVEEAVAGLGGLDALLYASGVSPLGRLVDTGADDWRAVFETNVVGAALVSRHAVGHLEASNGRALFLSSVSVEDPRPFLVPYGTEQGRARRTRSAAGATSTHTCASPGSSSARRSPSSASDWDPATVAALTEARAERGLVKATVMTAEEVAARVLDALGITGVGGGPPPDASQPSRSRRELRALSRRRARRPHR